MNPYDYLESEKSRIEKCIHFLIDNKQCLCEHGGLHTMIARKRKYTPGNVYNHVKETFIKNWKFESFLELDLSEDIPNFTNNDITERHMRCDIYIRELWYEMSKI